MCFAQKFLFIVAGRSASNNYLKKCEKFDFLSEKWIRISDLNVESEGKKLKLNLFI